MTEAVHRSRFPAGAARQPGGPSSRVGSSAWAVPVHFITGMSRSGTTWLCKVLNEHPHAVAFGETRFFAREFVPPGRDGCYGGPQLRRVIEGLKNRPLNTTMGGGPGCLRHVNLETQAAVIGSAFEGISGRLTPAEVFVRAARAIAEAEGKTVAIEKTPQHINWLDRIVPFMPESRFVVMIRDPYGFMLSYKFQGQNSSPRVRRNYRRRYHPFACALVWRGYFQAARSARRRYPDRVIVVRFEELVGSPETELERIQRFLGLRPLPLAERVPPVNSSFSGGRRPRLTAADIFWMNLVAGRAIEEYGVSRRPAVSGYRSIVGSWLRLPFWAVWNAVDFARRLSAGLAARYLWRWVQSAWQ